MGRIALSRWRTCLICTTVACASVFVASPALANSLRGESRAPSPVICSASSKISSCLAVIALAKSGTTESKISNYLENLWEINSKNGPPILGYYELQRCANPGLSPYQISCILWSSASRHTASLLSNALTSSHLFQIIDVTTFGHSTATSKAELEVYACLQISVPPEPGPGAFEAISIPDSTLSAFSRSGSTALESFARDYSTAALKQGFDAMRSALAKGVASCHRLGLRTAN